MGEAAFVSKGTREDADCLLIQWLADGSLASARVCCRPEPSENPPLSHEATCLKSLVESASKCPVALSATWTNPFSNLHLFPRHPASVWLWFWPWLRDLDALYAGRVAASTDAGLGRYTSMEEMCPTEDSRDVA